MSVILATECGSIPVGFVVNIAELCKFFEYFFLTGTLTVQGFAWPWPLALGQANQDLKVPMGETTDSRWTWKTQAWMSYGCACCVPPLHLDFRCCSYWIPLKNENSLIAMCTHYLPSGLVSGSTLSSYSGDCRLESLRDSGYTHCGINIIPSLLILQCT
jgi:hypothetical protein